MRILVIEDEIYLCEALVQILKGQNYIVDFDTDGESGLDDGLTGIYDVIVLDIMLPKLNGIELLKRLRENNIKTPVILLTAKGDINDKVEGLDSGADDYLAKPFNTNELLARIRALGRRRGEISENNSVIIYNDILLNTAEMKMMSGNKEVSLTLKEKDLMEYLMINSEKVISKERIIEKLWGFNSEAEGNYVEVYISFIRKKLKLINSGTSVYTVRGAGYILKKGENNV
ncbi:MAG: response regulator transcription factor [Clostridia bacterium]|nr:response regulator transcription factor [Clostridia bacterium]